jgi:K(+)-stimulated pyrophosphate-energized sodium pump
LASIIASFFVRLGKNLAVCKGLAVSVLLAAVGFYPLIRKIASLASLSVSGNKIYLASLMGLIMLAGIFMITEYFASKKHKPVKMIASASQDGQASNIIVGLAVSMQATVLPGLLICLGTLVSFWLAGIYGVALAAVVMVSLAGMVISIHAFDDNAKLFTDSYAIISAGLASLILFFNFSQELMVAGARLNFSFDDPRVIAGLFLGGLLPYLFSFLVMARAGLVSGLILALTPIAVGFVFGPLVLAGVLLGSILTGLFLGIFMTLGGSVWGNAKKYIEQGNYGGKDSFAFQSAVVGEAIADSCKDTVGPGISILNKAMNIAALVIIRFLA